MGYTYRNNFFFNRICCFCCFRWISFRYNRFLWICRPVGFFRCWCVSFYFLFQCWWRWFNFSCCTFSWMDYWLLKFYFYNSYNNLQFKEKNTCGATLTSTIGSCGATTWLVIVAFLYCCRLWYPVSFLKFETEFLKNLFGINVPGDISFSWQSGHSWSSDSNRIVRIPKKYELHLGKITMICKITYIHHRKNSHNTES